MLFQEMLIETRESEETIHYVTLYSGHFTISLHMEMFVQSLIAIYHAIV